MAVLTLLDERPMHGYELITVLEERSGGRWKPSPGAIYPALGKLEAARSGHVHRAGRQAPVRADRRRAARSPPSSASATESAPWERARPRRPRRPAAGARRARRARPARSAASARATQTEAASEVIKDATAKLYKILPTARRADARASPDDRRFSRVGALPLTGSRSSGSRWRRRSAPASAPP